MSFHDTKKRVLLSLVFFAAPCLIFFITGYVFYKPQKNKPISDAVKMPIERISPDSLSVTASTEEQKLQQGADRLSSASLLLPRVHGIPGQLTVSTRYAGLLVQMDSILAQKKHAQAPGSFADREQGLKDRDNKINTTQVRDDKNGAADGGMPRSSSLEETIRERMATINDVLEYAASQVGITADLLAAVAWAESTMLPFAINVQGKPYYFTSKDQALAALKDTATNDLDIGLFQVNYRVWGEPLGIQKEDLLDARVCALIGAMILKYNLQLHRDPWVGIGEYHSNDSTRMKTYQAKVSKGLIIIRTLILTAKEGAVSGPSGKSRQGTRDQASRNEGRLDS
jgi:hypothetical protein